jgi:transcriptional regulator with XRE-family HTH domain
MPRVALPLCHFQLTAQKPSGLPYPAQLNTLGDHLRKRRLDLGPLQREVAEEIGVTKSTIWNWEAYRSAPQLRFIPKVITFLGYDPHSTASGSLGERLMAHRRSHG